MRLEAPLTLPKGEALHHGRREFRFWSPSVLARTAPGSAGRVMPVVVLISDLGIRSMIRMKYLYTGVRVRDLERSIKFYRRVMGMRVSRRGKMGHGGVWVELMSPGSPQRLELNWYPPDSRFYSEYRNGEELDHLAFVVTDVNRAFQELVTLGAHPEVQPFREERYEFAFVSDPNGIWIELIGRIRPQRAR